MSLAAAEHAFQLRRRTRFIAGFGWGGVFACAVLVSAIVAELSPAALLDGLPRAGTYFANLVPRLAAEHLFAGTETEGSVAYWMYRLDAWAWLLFETSQMALLATLLGSLGGIACCFLAARNIAPNRLVFQLFRRVLELCRSVPDLVYALILVWTFGIGPLAGILAIAIHTTGALGKLFAEVVENADLGAWEGARSAGASWVQAVRYAILPQVLPNFLSYVLLRFEINVRGASVIGFVGAGGIGQELYTVISFNYYQEIGAILALIIVAVSVIDLGSEWLRRRAIGATA